MRYTLNYSLLSGIMADTQKPYAIGESKLFLQKLRLAVGLQTVWKIVLGTSSHPSFLSPMCVFFNVFYSMLWWPSSSGVKEVLSVQVRYSHV